MRQAELRAEPRAALPLLVLGERVYCSGLSAIRPRPPQYKLPSAILLFQGYVACFFRRRDSLETGPYILNGTRSAEPQPLGAWFTEWLVESCCLLFSLVLSPSFLSSFWHRAAGRLSSSGSSQRTKASLISLCAGWRI